jgi:hypothetical protein
VFAATTRTGGASFAFAPGALFRGSPQSSRRCAGLSRTTSRADTASRSRGFPRRARRPHQSVAPDASHGGVRTPWVAGLGSRRADARADSVRRKKPVPHCI